MKLLRGVRYDQNSDTHHLIVILAESVFVTTPEYFLKGSPDAHFPQVDMIL